MNTCSLPEIGRIHSELILSQSQTNVPKNQTKQSLNWRKLPHRWNCSSNEAHIYRTASDLMYLSCTHVDFFWIAAQSFTVFPTMGSFIKGPELQAGLSYDRDMYVRYIAIHDVHYVYGHMDPHNVPYVYGDMCAKTTCMAVQQTQCISKPVKV